MGRLLGKVFYFLVIFVIIFNVDSVYAKNYYVSNSEVVDNERTIPCWIGWKEWHFGATNPLSKKGDSIIFKTPMIQNGITSYHESVVTTNGYGHYSLEFSKHMLGLLSYMQNNVTDYTTSYVPIYDQPEFDSRGNLIEPTAVKMRKAVEITIGKLLRTWYSEDYENTEFKNFWTRCFTNDHIDELKKLQNDFYWKAYGEEAWALLKDMMTRHGGNYFSRLTTDQKKALKGVLFSVMEARYRNKNVQGKADLKIRAAEGEICPFLVNLKNLDKIVRSGDSGHYIYTDSVRQYTFYEFPPFDELIDGVYHWMIYYDSAILNSTTHSTLTRKQTANAEEEDVNADWESEYWALTGLPIETLTGKELGDFYTNCNLAKSIFKKSSENSEGIFGAEEVYDITSDINFSEALINMKNSMQDFANAVGGDIKKIFNGLDSEHIARTYTMAKNIVATYRIKDEYAYYDIGTNIINYTPGLNGDEYMLIDFQKVKLKSPLEIYDNGRIKTYEDSDNDGIYDRNEIRGKQKVDVTGFIKKMIEKELYGNDDNKIRDNQAIVNNTLNQVKYSIYNNRRSFDEENSDNNIQNRKEIYENNMNIDEPTRIELNGITSAAEQLQRLAMVPSKIEVELWKYDSNPVLKDTDFDGIDDGLGKEKLRDMERLYGLADDKKDDVKLRAIHCKLIPDSVVQTLRKDKNPKDNHFTGRMNTSKLSGDNAIEVDMNMDYRYFFLSNKQYYDELSTMSLLYANSIYRRGKDEYGNWMEHHSGITIKDIQNKASEEDEKLLLNGINYKNLKVKDMMEFFGFKNVKTYYMGEEMDNTASDYNIDDDPADGADYCRGYKDTHKGKVALGYKTLEYHGIYKNVIGIVIRGTAEDDDWDSDFDMGDIELRDNLKNIEPGINNYNTNYNNILGQLLKGVLDKYDKKYSEELLHFAGGYPDWKWDYHHAGFDIVSNRILEIVKEYYGEVEQHFDDDVELFDDEENKYVDGGVCFWVTGHSMGAGVANLIASSLICSDNVDIISGIGGNENNVYCYTFASPNTFYLTDNIYERESFAIPGKKVTGDYREPHGVRYRCIFNIVNDDDFVPKLPMEECEWTKYGRVAKLSIKNEIYNRCINTVKLYDYQTSHYSRPIGNPSDARYSFDMIKMSYMNYVTKNYDTNIFAINTIISSFNSMFADKTNMRNEAYRYVDNYVDYAENDDALEKGLGFYSKIYQKYNILKAEITTRTSRKTKDSVSIPLKIKRQYQMPAFVMQNVANAVHEKVPEWKERNGIREIEIRNQNEGIERNVGPFNIVLKENEAVLFDAKFAKWGMFVSKWSMLIGEGKFKAIDYPHYLESYYTLSKEITTTDFR